MAKRRRWVRVLLVLFGLLGAAVAALWIVLRHPLPDGGETGPAADALAHAIEANVGVDAWRTTGAVRWGFRSNRHLWDRTRNLARVDFGDGTVALVDVHKQRGVVTKHGVAVADPEAKKIVDRAYKAFINDSFWLNPLSKLFDDGVVRRKLTVDGHDALLITYTTGGVTPGDRYLWMLDGDGRPRAWRVWVQVIPIGGVEFSWEGWQTLATGATVATVHKVRDREALRLGDVAAAKTLAELEPGPDPFAALSP